MDKLNKLSLPVVILMASIILGGFYFASQVMKQGSIEKQQQIKIEQEEQELLTEQEANKQSEMAQRLRDSLSQAQLNTCLDEAEDTYDFTTSAFIQAIDEGKFDNVSNPEFVFDEAKKELETDKADCFKRYPQ